MTPELQRKANWDSRAGRKPDAQVSERTESEKVKHTPGPKHAITLIEEKEHLVAGRYAAVSAYDYKVRCDFLEAELARVRELLATQLR